MWKKISFYLIVLLGLAVVVASVFVLPDRAYWLLLFIPLLTIWSIWLVKQYWNWVRSL